MLVVIALEKLIITDIAPRGQTCLLIAALRRCNKLLYLDHLENMNCL